MEKCSYSVVNKPLLVFALLDASIEDIKNWVPNDAQYDMLLKAFERCVIDHKKDSIPQYAWDIVAPREKKKLAHYRAQECATPPSNTQEYWESNDWTLICYEAYGMCVWGFE